MRNLKISLFILALGVLMMSICFITKKFSSHKKEISMNIQTHIEPDLLTDLKIIINPKGYRMDGYSVKEYVGRNNSIYPLYPVTKIDEYSSSIISTSDYLIYAKYQDKYAVIGATNSIVVGDRNMNLNIYVYNQDRHLVLTKNFGYKYPHQSLDELIGDGVAKRHAFFYDKSVYQNLVEQNISDTDKIQIFEHHLEMINKLDALQF